MPRKPTQRELEDLVRWFTYHMPAEMRRQLMGDMPVHYKLLYPSADNKVLMLRVTERIAQVEQQSDVLPRTLNPWL